MTTASYSYTADLADEAATAALMADLGLLIGARDVITLSGDLGAGKTTAARALIRYLADDDALEVPSPTFTLAQGYDLALPVLHVDLYRVNDASELDELGLAAVSGRHARSDRVAGSRRRPAARRPHRYRVQPQRRAARPTRALRP